MNNYITENNGICSINCSSVPNKGFLDAVMVKDIAKIKILSADDKKTLPGYEPGGPDVYVVHTNGKKEYIYRKDVSKTYVHASGKKISMSILKNDKYYIVYRQTNEKFKIIKLPDNCSALLPTGATAKRGSYIVGKEDENGEIRRETLTSISPKMFRKQFRVPEQAIISRNIGKGGKKFSLMNNSKPNRTNNVTINKPVQTPKFDSSELGMNPSNISVPSYNDELNKKRVIVNKLNISNGGVKSNNKDYENIQLPKYKFTVTNKLVDTQGKLVGYTLKEISSGRTKKIKPNELAKFCVAKTVDNVMIVHREDGTTYLKGNGIMLEKLPVIIMS